MNMVEPEKFGHLHLVYHFTVPLKKQRDSRYIYQNKSGKACFQHDMAHGDFKGLSRRTASDEVLHDKAFNVAKNSNYDRYQCRLASVVYKYFDKKSTAANGCK